MLQLTVKDCTDAPTSKQKALDTNSFANYCSFSPPSFLRKVTEHMASEQLQLHVALLAVLDPSQSGFRRTYSKKTGLHIVTSIEICLLRSCRCGGYSTGLLLT